MRGSPQLFKCKLSQEGLQVRGGRDRGSQQAQLMSVLRSHRLRAAAHDALIPRSVCHSCQHQ